MAGPWERYQQGTPAQAPVIAPPDPYKQAAEERAQAAQARAEEAAERARQDQARQADTAALARERFEFEKESKQATPGKALRQGDSNNLRDAINQFADFTSNKDAFVDDFGGNLLGSLENTAQAYSPVEVGTPGQRDWWASLARVDNLIRNDLFGASLTAGEKQAYARTTVTPGMRPEEIRRNLDTREGIMRGALSRYVSGLKAAGWSEQEIDALMGDVAPRIFPEQQSSRDGRDDDPAAALATSAPPPPTSGGTDLRGPFVNSEGLVAGNPHDGGGSQEQALLDERYRREDNPVLAGAREEYLSRLGRGDSAQQLIEWARSAGVHPSVFPSMVAQAKYRQQHPEIAVSEYDAGAIDDQFVKVDPVSRALSDAARSPLGAGLIAAGDAASGFTLDNIVGATGGNAEQARLGMNQVAEENPISSTLGTIAGGTMMALGGEAALGARGMAAGLPRALVADSAYGAGAGAGATDYGPDGRPANALQRFGGAGAGAVAGAGGSYLGFRTGNALAAGARGVADASVNALRGEGVNALTVGQTFANSGRLGGMVKSVEDRIAGLPIIGDMVNARRVEGVRQFNSKAFDKALEPIGGTVGDLVGEEAVERAQDAVSDAFTRALAGKGAVVDQAFARDLTGAVMGVRSIKRIGDELDDEVADILEPYMSGQLLSGEALDDISRNLRDLKGRYRNDPLGVKAAKQIDRVERAIFDLFDRQASGTIPEYMAARQAYRRVSILEDSVLKARNQDDRLFTAAQLGQADRANAKKFGGKRAAARGDTPFHDYQTAGQAVLPSKIPDSGTAGRLAPLIPLAMVGGGAGADASGATPTGTGLTIGTILATLYSKTGQRILTKPGRGVRPGRARRVLESPATRRALGAAGAAGSAAALTGRE